MKMFYSMRKTFEIILFVSLSKKYIARVESNFRSNYYFPVLEINVSRDQINVLLLLLRQMYCLAKGFLGIN